MLILFSSSPLSVREVDPEYIDEWAAAGRVGFDRALVDIEALLAGTPEDAVRRVPQFDDKVSAVYRGWMLPVDRYGQLHAALANRGVDMMTSPEAYRLCHHLPASYSDIESMRPETVWLTVDEGLNIDNVMSMIGGFGDTPIIVKDFVKSRKHEWNDACYIRSAADRLEVERVVGNFVRGQGSDLAGGLVFRRFVPLANIGTDKRTGAPISVEYRLFFVNGKRIACVPHFEGEAQVEPPVSRFDKAGASIASPFFSMDIALTEAGDWIIVELGDGQVAGLPEALRPDEFYERLSHAIA